MFVRAQTAAFAQRSFFVRSPSVGRLRTPCWKGVVMKSKLVVAVGAVPLFLAGNATAQNGQMMNGGMGGGGWMGGYGGYWLPILLVVVIGLVAWVVMQKRK